MVFVRPLLAGAIGMSVVHAHGVRLFQFGEACELAAVVGGECPEHLIEAVLEHLFLPELAESFEDGGALLVAELPEYGSAGLPFDQGQEHLVLRSCAEHQVALPVPELLPLFDRRIAFLDAASQLLLTLLRMLLLVLAPDAQREVDALDLPEKPHGDVVV